MVYNGDNYGSFRGSWGLFSCLLRPMTFQERLRARVSGFALTTCSSFTWQVMLDGPLWTLPVLLGSPVAWSRRAAV